MGPYWYQYALDHLVDDALLSPATTLTTKTSTSLPTLSTRAAYGETDWASFLPKQFRSVIHAGDQEWVAKCLYNTNGRLKDHLTKKNWYHPPAPKPPMGSAPNPSHYFRQRLFVWAPMRMWEILLRCPNCHSLMAHSGIYPKAREVVGIESRYYLIGADYPCTMQQVQSTPMPLERRHSRAVGSKSPQHISCCPHQICCPG